MGGGNAQKSKTRKDRNNAKKAAAAKANNGARHAPKTNQCFICKQPFQITVKKPELENHSTTHNGKTFEECFPDYGKAPEPNQQQFGGFGGGDVKPAAKKKKGGRRK